METRSLTIEVDGGIGTDGVYASVWIGGGSEPVDEFTISWEEIIQKEIECYTLPNAKIIPYEDENDLDANFDVVKTLRAVADEMEEQLMSCQAFDRAAWMEANGGDYLGPRSKEEFCKPMKEFFNDA
jgi:hypothetical protein